MLRLIVVKVEVKTLFDGASALTIVAVAKGGREGSRLGLILRFGELVLRRGFEVVRTCWIWESDRPLERRLLVSGSWDWSRFTTKINRAYVTHLSAVPVLSISS